MYTIHKQFQETDREKVKESESESKAKKNWLEYNGFVESQCQ